MFTDTHCHLNRLDLTKYDGQLSGAIAAMKEANVTRAMAIMCDFAEYDEIAKVSNALMATIKALTESARKNMEANKS